MDHLPPLSALGRYAQDSTTVIVTVVSIRGARKYRFNQKAHYAFVAGTAYTFLMDKSTTNHPLVLSIAPSRQNAFDSPLGAFAPATTTTDWSVPASTVGKRLYAHCSRHPDMGSDLTLRVVAHDE